MAADPYGGWLTFTRIGGMWSEEQIITCRCGTWQRHVSGARLAAEVARGHVATHGVIIAAPPSRPVRARPAPAQNRAWQAAGMLAALGARRR